MITSSTTTGIDSTKRDFDAPEFTGTATTSRGFAFYDPQPVEVQISTPKKPRVLQLERAKLKEQRIAWGLRKR